MFAAVVDYHRRASGTTSPEQAEPDVAPSHVPWNTWASWEQPPERPAPLPPRQMDMIFPDLQFPMPPQLVYDQRAQQAPPPPPSGRDYFPGLSAGLAPQFSVPPPHVYLPPQSSQMHINMINNEYYAPQFAPPSLEPPSSRTSSSSISPSPHRGHFNGMEDFSKQPRAEPSPHSPDDSIEPAHVRRSYRNTAEEKPFKCPAEGCDLRYRCGFNLRLLLLASQARRYFGARVCPSPDELSLCECPVCQPY